MACALPRTSLRNIPSRPSIESAIGGDEVSAYERDEEMNLFDSTKTNERTRRREGKLRHADAVRIDQRPIRGRAPTRIIWAVACIVAMLGWMGALGWLFW